MAILNKEALLGRTQQQVKEIVLSDGNSVFIRKMRAVDMYGKQGWGESKSDMFSARCVHSSLCDEAGEPFFLATEYDESNLLQLSLEDFHLIWQEVVAFNGMGGKEGEPSTAEKN